MALPRGLRRPSYFNHLAKSGTPNRSTQSLGFSPPVSHWDAARLRLCLGARPAAGMRRGRTVVARFPPQTAKRWLDYCHKPRNAGPIIVTTRETKIFAAKYA